MAEDVRATLEVCGSPPLAGPPGVASCLVRSRVQSGSFMTPIEVVPRVLLPVLRVDLRTGFLFVYRCIEKGTNYDRRRTTSIILKLLCGA